MRVTHYIIDIGRCNNKDGCFIDIKIHKKINN